MWTWLICIVRPA